MKKWCVYRTCDNAAEFDVSDPLTQDKTTVCNDHLGRTVSPHNECIVTPLEELAPIFKTVYEITVLSEGRFLSDSLTEINYAITEGDCIGNLDEISSEKLGRHLLADVLISIGNDGTFFDRDNEGDKV